MHTPRRPSAATVIAMLALCAALTSPAWADSVKSLIKGKDIAKNAITSPKVKNRSLLAKDFKAGQLPKGDTGAVGPQGIPGPALTGGASDPSGTIGPIAGSMTDLLEGAETTGQLVLPWKGRITANGFADVSAATAAKSRTRCNLFISDGTGPNNGLAPFSPNAFGDTPAVENFHIAVPLAGFVVKPPGTYNIAVRCAVVEGSTVSYSASLTYTAVPAG
jgi:hypothetical protein